MAFNLNEFKQNLPLLGVRPNIFRCTLNIPVFATDALVSSRKSRFLIQSASIPSYNMGTIEMSYFGRKLKQPGDITFDPWTVTVLNDEDFAIRNSVDAWRNQINSTITNLRQDSTIPRFGTDILIEQFGKDTSVIKTITLKNAWPSNLSAIELNMETNNTLETYTVEFTYDWWEDSLTSF